MSITVARTVVGELAVTDRNRAAGTGEKPVLVVEKVVAIQDEIAAFEANSGTVAVRDARSGKREMVDVNVAVDDEDTLAVRNIPACDQVHHAADAVQRDVLVDRREI